MCVYTYTQYYIYIRIYTHIYIYIFKYTHIHIYAYTHIHIHTYIQRNTRVYIHIYIYIYTHTYVCIGRASVGNCCGQFTQFARPPPSLDALAVSQLVPTFETY